MLAVDRGNPEVQYIYNEMHPVILYQLSYVIRVCKREGVKTSICGQAVNNKEMIKFLVEKGIDSISVNADVASEIAEYIESIEKELIKGTDREPRHYELKKRKEESEKISEEESSENFKKDLIDNDKNNPKESNLDIF